MKIIYSQTNFDLPQQCWLKIQQNQRAKMRKNQSIDFLDHIAAKFIANLPREELTEDRLGYHFQCAYFYYIDREGLDSILDRNYKSQQVVQFCRQILKIVSCPQLPKLSGEYLDQLIEENYSRVPVHGVIILNREETKAVMVESKDTCKLGFPKGKIRQGETPESCAVREAYQQIGLKVNVDPNDYLEVEIKAKAFNKSYVKNCRFFITRIEQCCIVPRVARQQYPNETGYRDIIHSNTEIRSIGWYHINNDIYRFIEQGRVNSPSKVAYFELMKKLKKVMYQEKKNLNPLEEFKGFDKKLSQIFVK